MKINYIKGIVAATCLGLGAVACTSILDEEPRAILDPGFFETEQGVVGGITALYARLRDVYGQEYYYAVLENGTDEYTWGQNADSNFKDADLSGAGVGVTSSSSRSSVLWGNTFTNINTANGIVENGEIAGVDISLIAEARFFRGFYYFELVKTFGGVPLDLGAGELRFNSSPSRVSVRNSVPEVYTKAIFSDLLKAIEDLPVDPRLPGSATKNVARLFLSKAYLTYAWWLENPNNIPTYPETSRVDPDGHDAQWYYQAAYDIAIEAIENPGPYRLQDYYYDIHLGTNDRNSECMFYSDHTENSEFYSGGSYGYGKKTPWVWFVTSDMPKEVRSYKDGALTEHFSALRREAAQNSGRPWTRMAPPIEVFTKTFIDKDIDSRFDGTFVTSYRTNWDRDPLVTSPPDSVYNANGLKLGPNQAALTFLGDMLPDGTVTYPSPEEDKSGVDAGEISGRSDWIIEPNRVSRLIYPGLWKIGTFRSKSEGLWQPNGDITRPWNIAKFSEFYFLAAEAAVKGATGTKTARDLINIIRERAGKWCWDNGANKKREEDNSAAMAVVTPAVIDIDYILMERSREYFGEGYRWPDLVRTQKWGEFGATYSICPVDGARLEAKTFTRNIQPYLYLRPIPQGQLDALEMTAVEKDAYQNPGYN
ncbi:MAG: RagB/SusD family nutrient uptake outer membrane protein [Bacteroidales bacterium]